MNHKKWMLLSGVFIGFCLYGFFALFESYEEMRDLGWGAAAHRNPFLAAEQFLVESGQRVQSADQFEKLDALPLNGTVLIRNSSHVLSSKRLEGLIAWTKKGGHLIVAAGAPGGEAPDRLLSYFAIEVLVTEDVSEEGQDDFKIPTKMSEQLRRFSEASQGKTSSEKTNISFEERVPEDAKTSLVFEDVDEEVTAHFLQNRKLQHPFFDWEGAAEDFEGYRPFYWEGDEKGIHFMQMQVEAGTLTVLSDADIWRSSNIGHFDHAFLLRILSENSEGVYILYGIEMPSVLALLGRHVPEFLLAASFWLLAWLFYRGRRFGPIKSTQLRVRRSMAEHVSASAAYLWRAGFRAELLIPLQSEIEKRACRVLPSFIHLEKEARLKSLSLQSGLAPSEIENALYSDEQETEAGFVRRVRCLQKIRSHL